MGWLFAFSVVFKVLDGLYPDRMCLNVLQGHTFASSFLKSPLCLAVGLPVAQLNYAPQGEGAALSQASSLVLSLDTQPPGLETTFL